MNKLKVEYNNNEIVVLDDQTRLAGRSSCDADFDKFKEWIGIYNHAVEQNDNKGPLLEIGRDLFKWLNFGNGWLAKYIRNTGPSFVIEFQIPVRSSEVQKAFIEAPWELLADETEHLAKDPDLKFCPIRRIGNESENKRDASKYKLNTVFMAASPRHAGPELAYEREEAAILSLYSEKSINMDLFVEESGNLSQLTELINQVKPVDVVHISCHGNIDDDNPEKSESYLCLETITGNIDEVTVDGFELIYTQNKPALIFLSACKTSEAHTNKGIPEKKEYGTFTQTIIKRGFPAVLGWSGPVSDFEATRFSGEFYRNLSQASTVEDAVVKARYALFIPPKEDLGPYESNDWHLARLYLGAEGGGIISEGNDERFDREKDAGVKEFLGKKEKGLEVAGRNEFVGRRRHIQDVLKEFRDNVFAGVLVHGIGNQGKSSLAARIANRMHSYDTVLIYGKKCDERMYSAYHVLNECKTVAGLETEKHIDQLLSEVEQNEAYLKASLKGLLEGPFSGKDNNHRAILMVVDDLEKILTEPKGDSNLYAVKTEYRTTLISIITAFKEARTKSRLIITSRYGFELVDKENKDIAGMLMKLPLTSMNDTEAVKQYSAKYGAIEKEKDGITLGPVRVVEACKGNPGLQDMVFSLFSHAPKSYLKALEGMEDYLSGGGLPEEQKVQDFLQDLAIDNILGLLTDGEMVLIKVATLFKVPVPEEVFDNISNKAEIQKGVDYKKRLLGFGVIEQFEDLVYSDRKSLLLNNIIRPRIEDLSPDDINDFAGIIAETLFTAWCADMKVYHPWICDREIVKFGLIAKHSRSVMFCAENCIRGMHDNFLTKYAVDIAVSSISLLEDNRKNVPEGLYRTASDVCHSTGKVEKALEYIEKALDKTEEDSHESASCYLRLGRILVQKSDIEKAIEAYEKSKGIFVTLKAGRESAIVSGDIARIKVSKGEVDEALKLHKEELDVYDKLGDTRSKAVALGDIARIKVSKGEVDEALRLHQEVLRICDQLGDAKGKAVTLGNIARIKVSKGEVDEALKLHQERILVFDKLGDTREKAVALGDIARIKVDKGKVDEALKLHQERILVFDKLGDTRSKAVALGDIARIKVSKGEVDEALKLHQERILVFDKLGDLDGRAATLWKMSTILLQKDEIQEAFEYLSESYQIFLKIGRLDGISMVGWDLGVLLCKANQKEEGLKILKRSRAGFEKLGQKDYSEQIQEIIDKGKE